MLFGTGRLRGIGSDWAMPCGDFRNMLGDKESQ